MNSPADDLAIRLTTALIATDGIRGMFPQSVVAAAAAAFIRSDKPGATGLVTVDLNTDPITITARLATDSTIPTTQVALAAAATIRQHLENQPFHLHLEIAHLV